MKRFVIAVAVAAALSGAGMAHAELKATPLPGDSRLVTFNYDADNTFLILTRPKMITRLQLAKGEQVQTLAAGDTSSFEIKATTNLDNVLIKPKFPRVMTSLTLITTVRSYEIILKSNDEGEKFYQRVQWEYPELQMQEFAQAKTLEAVRLEKDAAAASGASGGDDQIITADLSPENMQFDYIIDGDASFRPIQVMDNRKFTWVRLPEDTQIMPALLEVIDGKEHLVNYLPRPGRVLMVQKLMDSFVLRYGDKIVKVTRKGTRSRWERNGVQQIPYMIPGG